MPEMRPFRPTLLLGGRVSRIGAYGHGSVTFNTDQDSQFASPERTGKLECLGIKVSMDGKGRWMDNVFIERLWRSLKYEDVYLREYSTLGDLEHGLGKWFARYNTWRPHEALGNRTPEKAYLEDRKEKMEA